MAFWFEEKTYDKALSVFERLYARLSRLNDKIFKRRPDLKKLRLLSTEVLAALLLQQKEFERADSLIQELIQLTAPQQPEARWLQMRLLHRLEKTSEDFETMMDELRALAVMNPDDKWAWLTMGRLWLNKENYAEAESNLKRALKHNGSFTDFMFTQTTLFHLYRKQKRFNEAEDAIKALWAGIDNPAAKMPFPLYKMRLQNGNFKRAAYWLKHETNLLRKNFYHGVLAEKQGNKKTARKFWQKTAAEDPARFDDGLDSWLHAALLLEKDPAFILKTIDAAAENKDDFTQAPAFYWQ